MAELCSVCTLREAIMGCDCRICEGSGIRWCSDKCFCEDGHVDESKLNLESRTSFFKRSKSSSSSGTDDGSQVIMPILDRYVSVEASVDRSKFIPMTVDLFKDTFKVRVKVRVLNEKVTFEAYSKWTSKGEANGPIDTFEMVFIKNELRFVENSYEAFELKNSKPGKKITVWVYFDPRDYKVTSVRDSRTGLISKRLVKDWTAFLRLRIYIGDKTRSISKMLIV